MKSRQAATAVGKKRATERERIKSRSRREICIATQFSFCLRFWFFSMNEMRWEILCEFFCFFFLHPCLSICGLRNNKQFSCSCKILIIPLKSIFGCYCSPLLLVWSLFNDKLVLWDPKYRLKKTKNSSRRKKNEKIVKWSSYISSSSEILRLICCCGRSRMLNTCHWFFIICNFEWNSIESKTEKRKKNVKQNVIWLSARWRTWARNAVTQAIIFVVCIQTNSFCDSHESVLWCDGRYAVRDDNRKYSKIPRISSVVGFVLIDARVCLINNGKWRRRKRTSLSFDEIQNETENEWMKRDSLTVVSMTGIFVGFIVSVGRECISWGPRINTQIEINADHFHLSIFRPFFFSLLRSAACYLVCDRFKCIDQRTRNEWMNLFLLSLRSILFALFTQMIASFGHIDVFYLLLSLSALFRFSKFKKIESRCEIRVMYIRCRTVCHRRWIFISFCSSIFFLSRQLISFDWCTRTEANKQENDDATDKIRSEKKTVIKLNAKNNFLCAFVLVPK